MTEESVRATILECVSEIAPEADLARLDPEADLREDLDLDSMDFLRLVQSLDRKTGVAIPEADYASIRSLRALVGYVSARATRDAAH